MVKALKKRNEKKERETGTLSLNFRKSKKGSIGWQQKEEAHMSPVERDLNGR